MQTNQVHEHSFENIVIPSTCRERGYTLHRCACGYEHKDQFTPLGKHAYVLTGEKTPDCENAGSREYCCTVCGDRGTQTISPLGHDWNGWKVCSFATCTESGLQTRQCNRCGKIQEQVLPATGHRCRKQKNADGCVEYYCSNCGTVMEKPEKKKLAPKKKKTIIGIVAAVLAVALLAVAAYFLQPAYDYYAAQHHIKQEEYEDAYYHLLKCLKFKDTKTLLKDFEVQYENETRKKITYDENGKVKSEETTTIGRKFNNNGDLLRVTENGKIASQYEYNAAGKCTQAIHYDEDGSIYSKYVYKYDADGNNTQKLHYDRDGRISFKDVYEYDHAGNVIKNTYTYYGGGSGTVSVYTYEYDRNGNRILAKRFGEDGKLQWKETYEYDRDGNQTMYAHYDSNGDLMYKHVYEYDRDGNKTMYAQYGEDGLNYKYVNEYDDDGNCTKWVKYDGDGKVVSKAKTEYDENGCPTYITQYDEEGKANRYRAARAKYDKYGVLLELIYYDEDGDVDYEIERSKDLKTEKYTSYSYDWETGVLESKSITESSNPVITYHPKEK